MKIYDRLLANEGMKIRRYFKEGSESRWISRYKDKVTNNTIVHDEPWLTLIALYSIFGSMSNRKDPKTIKALEYLLISTCRGWEYKIQEIKKVQVEYQVPEIRSFREYLRKLTLEKGPYHLYPDRNKKLEEKAPADGSPGKYPSFEGNTNIDAYLEIGCKEGRVAIIIESKFLSDIDCKITYNPVRDQIARNIDCGIDMVLGGDADPGIDVSKKEDNPIVDFYFFMLTPGLFRPASFGPLIPSSLDVFAPDRSRLYCYKMLDYINQPRLMDVLPHRQDDPRIDWERISKHLGWMTFEEILQYSLEKGLIPSQDEEADLKDFFSERNLIMNQ